jgi:hypothetical protein
MKNIRLIFTILCILCCSVLTAQTTYKGVTIDRDKSDNTCITVKNSNKAPVKVKLQYKIGSRETNWIDYGGGGYIRVEGYDTRTLSVGSKIYGLNLIYVDILNGEQFFKDAGEFIGDLFSGSSSSSSSSSGSSTGSSTSSYSSSSSGMTVTSTGSGRSEVKKGGKVIGELIYTYTIKKDGDNGSFLYVKITNTTDEYVRGRITGTRSSSTCGDSFRIHPHGETDYVVGCGSLPGGAVLEYIQVED